MTETEKENEADVREEIIRTVRHLDAGRLAKLQIFVEGLTAARQRDSPNEKREETLERGEQSYAD